MGNFNRSFNRGRRSDNRMYSAVCDKCGRDCQVPFKPTGSKPIYCSQCFEEQSGNSDRRRSSFRDDRRSAPRNNYRRSYSPRSNNGGGNNQFLTNLTKKVEHLSSQLDQIIKLLSVSKPKSKTEVKTKTKIKKSKPKVKKVKKATKKKSKK